MNRKSNVVRLFEEINSKNFDGPEFGDGDGGGPTMGELMKIINEVVDRQNNLYDYVEKSTDHIQTLVTEMNGLKEQVNTLKKEKTKSGTNFWNVTGTVGLVMIIILMFI